MEDKSNEKNEIIRIFLGKLVKIFRILGYLLFQLFTCSLCVHFKTKKEKFADFIKKTRGFTKKKTLKHKFF